MSLQAKLAAFGGDIWGSRRCLALWPWPAVVCGMWEWKFTEDDYRCLTHFIKPGDMLLTKSQPYFLSNYFIAGSVFKHLAVYTGAVKGIKKNGHGFITAPKSLGLDKLHATTFSIGEYQRTVTHAISEGVVCQDILRLVGHCDYVIVVRPWKTAAQQMAIVDFALKQVGLGYNFDFTPKGPPELYCTELGSACLKEIDVELPETVKMRVSLLGKQGDAYLADAFVAKYDPVCCSVSCFQPSFFRSSPFGDIIRQKLLKAENAGV